MRLPWVRRDEHEAELDRVLETERRLSAQHIATVDATCSALERQLAANETATQRIVDGASREAAAMERSMVASEARYAELMTRYHQLRLQGHTPGPTDRVPPVTVRDPVLEAVNQACEGKDPRVRAGMMRQVAIDRKAELGDEDIILRIQRGNRPAEDVS